ncbi:MAG: DUF1549 domain-containing protein, partial [Planctomycetes bacterium]|nr:DUF1549 domain-containing protein [Planctomycetota bacterium]
MRNGLLKNFFGSLILLLSASVVVAEERVDYLREIKPILAARCFACHGALKQESGLRLDTGALIRKGGDGGPVVVLGNVKNSSLLQRVSATDESERMPSLGKPLTPEQIELIKRWIEQGATSPADEQPEEDPKLHWAFQRPVRPTVPKVSRSRWVYNPVDAFIAAEHERRNLKPNSPAAKHVLLRRVTLDLIGLPPTRQEYHAFLADDSPKAYEKLVNRLLDSRQYGERWGRHWMDVWRYSDWYGRRTVNDVRNSYPHIWRWRDWIINSLNDDKGYDRMIMEMLAADEIAPEDDEAIVATGFIVRNWFSLNYDQWMKDLVEHTGKAFLGIRMNCAHCHDHKYDPISQEEYFRFRAFFEPIELRHDRVPGGPALTQYKRYVPGSGASLKPIKAGLARIFDFDLNAETYMYRLGDARDRFQDEPPVSPGAPAFLGGDTLQIKTIDLPPSAWYPGLKSFVRKEETAQRKKAIETAETALANAKQNLSGKTDSLSVSSVHLAEARLSNAHAQLKSLQTRVAVEQSKYLQDSDEKTVADLAKDASHAERNAGVTAAKLTLAEAKKSLAAANVSKANAAKQKSAITTAQKKMQAATKAVAAAEKNLKTDSDSYTPLGPIYPSQS